MYLCCKLFITVARHSQISGRAQVVGFKITDPQPARNYLGLGRHGGQNIPTANTYTHHILCFLSQKEAARTSLLSKQWRHIGSTCPNLEFSEQWFDNDTQQTSVPVDDRNYSILHKILYLLSTPWRHIGSSTHSNLKLFKQDFVSVVNRTLQGYLDQNLSTHKLHLDLSSPDSRPVVSLLDKWIPILAALTNIKSFKLDFLSYTTLAHYNLPSAMFLAESLEELHLRKCRLSPVKSVRLKRCLRTLTLEQVQVDGATFEKMITSGCPVLSRLVLTNCCGLRNVRLSEEALPALKHFVLYNYQMTNGVSSKSTS
ncbi:Putative F-box/LRR-repeat protein [Striga hermonthica]|uniref:F-box/LRR-repeat protein n=1 Tax=Striga hermonthica TaxID=68872 RepID=A0A9N7N921_STRHE|nr:Putative F-box/LRR-repeat protein [Striga hermonthica]